MLTTSNGPPTWKGPWYVPQPGGAVAVKESTGQPMVVFAPGLTSAARGKPDRSVRGRTVPNGIAKALYFTIASMAGLFGKVAASRANSLARIDTEPERA